MTVNDFYQESLQYGYYSMVLLIDFLVHEKKVIRLSDPEEKLHYFLQEKFHKSLNGYLRAYEEKRRNSSNA